MSDDMGKVSKEALLALSRYLPAKHQSKAANDVFLSVDSAFRTLERQLVRAREALKWYAGDGSTIDGIDVGQKARAALQDIAAAERDKQ
jgi:hypothetical protein